MYKGRENLYTKDSIRTHSGKYVNVFDPDPRTIVMEDIAHSLSNQCRFGGHLPRFYSVAQHCINCVQHVPDELRLQVLLHDASEAYLMDIPKPIKEGLPEYKRIENQLMIVIANKFGFEYPMSDKVKSVDKVICEVEWNEIMLGRATSKMTEYMPRSMARDRFLLLYKQLKRNG